MRARRHFGPWPFSTPQADRVRVPPNPWKPGDKVRFCRNAKGLDEAREFEIDTTCVFLGKPSVRLQGVSGVFFADEFVAASEIVTPAAKELLAAARNAWRQKAAAAATLSRLRKYRAQSAAMKNDSARAADQLREAELVLKRILGGSS